MDLRFFEIYRNPEYLLLLGKGALLSASLTVLAAAFGLVLAFGLAAVRYGRVPVLEWIAAAYVEFIRNTPLIVQLFFIAFGLPLLLRPRSGPGEISQIGEPAAILQRC